MKSFYDILGDDKIQQLVHEFYNRVFTSEKIRPLFQNDRKKVIFYILSLVSEVHNSTIPQFHNSKYLVSSTPIKTLTSLFHKS